MDAIKVTEEGFAAAREKLEKLQRKAVKLGLPPLRIEVDGEVFEPQKDGTSRKFLLVRVEGNAPTLPGFKLIGKIDHLLGGEGEENILASAPGCKIPETYRKCENVCDHCLTSRKRHETYVLQNVTTGVYEQIGRNCLADYVRDEGAGESIVQWYKDYNGLVQSLGSDEGGHGYGKRYVDVASIIRTAYRVIQAHGWLPRWKAQETGGCATADHVRTLLFPINPAPDWLKQLQKEVNAVEVPDGYVDEVILWGQSIDPDNASDYLNNIRVLCNQEYVDPKYIALLASAVPTKEGIKRKEEERKSFTPGTHQGELKKRANFDAWTVKAIRGPYASDFGPRFCVNFETADGSLVTWWAGETLKLEDKDIGKTYNVRATPQKHEVYHGRNQTVVNRVDLLTEVTKDATANETTAGGTGG